MKENWILVNKKESFLKLSEFLDANPLVLRLLANRGIDDIDLAKRFLKGTVEDLYDGYLMKDMKKGVSIVKEAILKNKKIIIYGDYDCDGVNSTTILYKALKAVGANYGYYIPNREEEGYGMHSGRIKKLSEEGYEVVLTCDNGISAFEQVELAKSLGMEVVITDHHDIPLRENEDGILKEQAPKADAVINPKQKDCNYPFKMLCGAGIALKFSKCLFNEFNIKNEEFLDLFQFAAIATVCDVVDLVDENRIIVKKGLELLNKSENYGIQELKKATLLNDKKIEEYHLGFVIGPCINATGRLETADLSVELLITKDRERAKVLANQLSELNTVRQDLTKESTERIINRIEAEKNKSDKVIVVYDENVHESIAGIVAGRVKEKYNMPCIVLTKGKEMPKGSARSIEGYNITQELSKCSNLIEKFGGHPMAAGLSIKEENIKELRRKLNENCILTDEDLVPIVKIDLPLSLNYLNEELINTIEALRPYGKGNPSPLFAVKDLFMERMWLLGKEKNFLKLRFRFELNGKYIYIDGISFDKFESFKEDLISKYGNEKFVEACNTSYLNLKADVIYYPNINEFNGSRNIQLNIKNIRIK
ncbi:MAG: single-stranded-DNA-specific exonuclease RecJ [Clostridium sp.]|uniref:single-stranded-DNA-specific exonuclease RecJ n=1 Tax=Clostridium sp. TaxID=1506 RepID=UPI00280C2296|nr:single-stranded-DNA-specific exonuclease RecJ [Clostridium sp.]MCI6691434.1 single-stranded-DNA-specific exonuclease RecJ [Clostridium sp.]MDY2630279.1 single-stranded-DNA-specific exonuclease RecJ [Clostridium sp.]